MSTPTSGVATSERRRRARISLRWVVRDAEALGLITEPAKKEEVLRHFGRDGEVDALAPAHDEAVKLGWRLMGWLPRRGWSAAEQRGAGS